MDTTNTVLRWIAVLIAVAIGAQEALSEPMHGQDFLAAQQKGFDLGQAAIYFGQNTASGNLDFTFGTDLTKLDAFLSATHPQMHRTHIINGTCIRGNNCGSYEYVKGFSVSSFDAAVKKSDKRILDPFKARVKAYHELALKHPETKFLISPVLEHQLSKESYRVLADAVLSVWIEGVQLVNSPMGGVAIERYKGAWVERHGTASIKDGDIVSFDGAGATDANIPAFLSNTKNAKIVLVWERQYNCRTNSPKWVDPRARIACPRPVDFELLSHILDTRPAKVAFSGGVACKSVKPFAPPYIWKPMAEDTGGKDARKNMPVALISGAKGINISVLSSNGASVGTLGRYDRDMKPPTQTRYYSSYAGGSKLSGYQFEKRAAIASSSPWVWVRLVSKACFGPFIPGMRGGLTK